MADRATTLLSTALIPVRALLGLAPGRGSRGLPAHALALGALPLRSINLAIDGDAARAAQHYGEASEARAAARLRERDLGWLADLHAGGKLIHAHHAVRRLAQWSTLPPGNFSTFELARAVWQLAATAPDFALRCSHGPAAVPPVLLRDLLDQRCSWLEHRTPSDGQHALLRAMAWTAAALVLSRSARDLVRALAALDHAMNVVIAGDGSLRGSTHAAAAMLLVDLIPLLAEAESQGVPLPHRLTGSVSKLADFIALLHVGGGHLAMTVLTEPQSERLLRCLSAMPPAPRHALAPDAGFARMAGGNLIVAVVTARQADHSHFTISTTLNGQQVFTIRGKTEDGSELHLSPGSVLFAQKAAGLALQDVSGQNRLCLYLDDAGSDVRLERSAPASAPPVHLSLEVYETARLSTQQNGSGAVLVVNRTQAWQLITRGAVLRQSGGSLELSAAPGGNRINLALKKAGSQARKPRKRPARRRDVPVLNSHLRTARLCPITRAPAKVQRNLVPHVVC